MTLPTVDSAQYPTPDEVLSQILADLRWAYAQIGVTVNVERWSEAWIRAKAFADRVSIAIANNQLARTAMSPLTATGDDLVTLAGIFGVTKRPAVAASGFVVVGTQNLGGSTYATVIIPVDFGWTAPDGTKCKAEGGTYTNGELAAVTASTTGANTNIAAGVLGSWDSAAIGFLNQQARVATGGIDGGHAEDDEETLRARLLRKLSRPAVGGNSAHVQEVAEESSSAIEQAFVYQAARGPGSFDVALTAAGGDRTVTAATITAAATAITTEMPGMVDINVTTVVPEEIDVVLGLTLPLPKNAGGAGGGWFDGTPWPSTAETVPNTYGEITSIASINVSKITVNSSSDDPPLIGNHIAIWNPTLDADGVPAGFSRFGIANVTGSSGAYEITLDVVPGSSLSFITVGMRCSPDCARLEQYGDAFVAGMAALGPGEKTASPEILPRGRRVPGIDETAPSDATLSPQLAVANVGPEVMGLAGASYATGTFTAKSTPSIPATTLLAPRILVLKHFSLLRRT